MWECHVSSASLVLRRPGLLHAQCRSQGTKRWLASHATQFAPQSRQPEWIVDAGHPISTFPCPLPASESDASCLCVLHPWPKVKLCHGATSGEGAAQCLEALRALHPKDLDVDTQVSLAGVAYGLAPSAPQGPRWMEWGAYRGGMAVAWPLGVPMSRREWQRRWACLVSVGLSLQHALCSALGPLHEHGHGCGRPAIPRCSAGGLLCRGKPHIEVDSGESQLTVEAAYGVG